MQRVCLIYPRVSIKPRNNDISNFARLISYPCVCVGNIATLSSVNPSDTTCKHVTNGYTHTESGWNMTTRRRHSQLPSISNGSDDEALYREKEDYLLGSLRLASEPLKTLQESHTHGSLYGMRIVHLTYRLYPRHKEEISSNSAKESSISSSSGVEQMYIHSPPSSTLLKAHTHYPPLSTCKDIHKYTSSKSFPLLPSSCFSLLQSFGLTHSPTGCAAMELSREFSSFSCGGEMKMLLSKEIYGVATMRSNCAGTCVCWSAPERGVFVPAPGRFVYSLALQTEEINLQTHTSKNLKLRVANQEDLHSSASLMLSGFVLSSLSIASPPLISTHTKVRCLSIASAPLFSTHQKTKKKKKANNLTCVPGFSKSTLFNDECLRGLNKSNGEERLMGRTVCGVEMKKHDFLDFQFGSGSFLGLKQAIFPSEASEEAKFSGRISEMPSELAETALEHSKSSREKVGRGEAGSPKRYFIADSAHSKVVHTSQQMGAGDSFSNSNSPDFNSTPSSPPSSSSSSSSTYPTPSSPPSPTSSPSSPPPRPSSPSSSNYAFSHNRSLPWRLAAHAANARNPPLPPSSSLLTKEIYKLEKKLTPPPQHHLEREGFLREFQRVVECVFAGCKVLPFGSITNGFYSVGSDVDICLNIPSCSVKGSQIKMLRRIASEIVHVKTHRVIPIFNAQIPILRWKSHSMGAPAIDISVNNVIAVVNSRLIAAYQLIYPPLRPLGVALKYWARCRDLNDRSKGTLSSFSLLIMMIYFLQRKVSPPMLPSLQNLAVSLNYPPVYFTGLDCRYCTDWGEILKDMEWKARRGGSSREGETQHLLPRDHSPCPPPPPPSVESVDHFFAQEMDLRRSIAEWCLAERAGPPSNTPLTHPPLNTSPSFLLDADLGSILVKFFRYFGYQYTEGIISLRDSPPPPSVRHTTLSTCIDLEDSPHSWRQSNKAHSRRSHTHMHAHNSYFFVENPFKEGKDVANIHPSQHARIRKELRRMYDLLHKGELSFEDICRGKVEG